MPHERDQSILSQFLSEEDDRFIGLRGTRDTVARQLHEQGIGASVKHTEIIIHEEEAFCGNEDFWELVLLSHSSMPSFL